MAPVPLRSALAALAAAPVLAAVGCGAGGGARLRGAAAAGRTVRFALDWTPNTNHTGLYVAQQQGWFTDAGLDVQILPYNSTSPDTLVSLRRRRVRHLVPGLVHGLEGARARTSSRCWRCCSTGAPPIGMRADRADLRSPRDLDGKTYGGLRRRLRGAEDAGDHPRGGREG